MMEKRRKEYDYKRMKPEKREGYCRVYLVSNFCMFPKDEFPDVITHQWTKAIPGTTYIEVPDAQVDVVIEELKKRYKVVEKID